MNIIIIFILLFTFTLKAKGTNNYTSSFSSTDTSPITEDGSESLKSQNSTQGTNNYTSSFSSTDTSPMTEDGSESLKSQNPTQGTNNYTSSFSSTDTSPMTEDGSESLKSQNPTQDCPKTHNSECKKKKAGNDENKEKMENKANAEKTLDLRTVLIFMLGVICSTAIFSTVSCFVIICNRCRRTNAKTDKERIILQAVKSDQSVMHEDQTDEQTPLHVQSTDEVSRNTSAVNSGTEEERKIIGQDNREGAAGVNEVDYASINYSLLQKKADGDLKPQKVESDYAEIQLKKPNEGQKVETLQDGEKQDEVKQDGVKQDGVDQGLEGEMESQKQMELDEVQV